MSELRVRSKLDPVDRTACPYCDSFPSRAPVLGCSQCKVTTHIRCLGLTTEQAMRINKYYCDTCKHEKGQRIEWEPDRTVEGRQANPEGPTQPLRQLDDQARTVQDATTDKDQSSQSQGSENEQPTVQPNPRNKQKGGDNMSVPQVEPVAGPSSGRPQERPRLILRVPRAVVDQANDAATSEDSASQSSTEYDVKNITEVKLVNGTLMYHVYWLNGEDTWEPEESCVGCAELVNALRASRGLGESTVVRPIDAYGASGDATRFNRDNWVSIEKTIEAVNKFDRVKDGTPPVKKFEGSLEDDHIMMLGLSKHIYVIYRSPLSGDYYIADGGNYYIKDDTIKNQVQLVCGIQPRAIKFVGQDGVDNCSSSAVLIALEFRRTFRARQEPTLLKAERTISDRVKAAFHQYESKPEDSDTVLRNLEPDICPICGKSFPSRNRRAFSGHMAGHRRKLN